MTDIERYTEFLVTYLT